jgi:hypothetical protein
MENKGNGGYVGKIFCATFIDELGDYKRLSIYR